MLKLKTNETSSELENKSDLSISVYVNDKLFDVDVDPEMTAVKFLREHLGFVGTKEPCAEGDCGGCTIALGYWHDNEFHYRAVNSCILPVSRLHGCHVITIEGLAKDKKLHIIQEEMIKHHAVQCGYCTPGVIMSIFCLLVNNFNPDKDHIKEVMSGNLCRCTGYNFINDAILETIYKINNNSEIKNKLMPFYSYEIQNNLKKIVPIQRKISNGINKNISNICKNYFVPKNLNDLILIMSQLSGRFSIINGGTDLMVQANIHDVWPENFIDISQIEQLNFIHEYQDRIIIGSNVTYNQIVNICLVKEKIAVLLSAISRLGSYQIRNIATLTGNIVNASPIADAANVLLSLGASLIIKNIDGSDKKINLEDFFIDYKVIALDKAKEFVYGIEIPFSYGYCNFEKTSKRKSLDISTVNSCINMEISSKIIKKCRLSFGGVFKYPALAKATCNFLIGKEITKENIKLAQQIVIKEFTPISDVRGSDKYRSLLIGNHIIKHFDKIIEM